MTRDRAGGGRKLGDAVLREKRREDALRAQPSVRHVVRWTWHEIDDFEAVAERLRALATRPTLAGSSAAHPMA